MRNVLWHQPLIQRALSSYDARWEFGEKERSVRSARSESRVALASIVLSKQNVIEQGKRFSQDEMQRPKF